MWPRRRMRDSSTPTLRWSSPSVSSAPAGAPCVAAALPQQRRSAVRGEPDMGATCRGLPHCVAPLTARLAQALRTAEKRAIGSHCCARRMLVVALEARAPSSHGRQCKASTCWHAVRASCAHLSHRMQREAAGGASMGAGNSARAAGCAPETRPGVREQRIRVNEAANRVCCGRRVAP